MLLEQTKKAHKILIKNVVCCGEMDYGSESIRPLLNAIFELGDFITKSDSSEQIDWSMQAKQSNVFTIKEICQCALDQKVDLQDSVIRYATQLDQRYTEALSDTKKYLERDGLFEQIKGGWVYVFHQLNSD